MAQRYQLVSPRPKKDGGTFWHPVGTAWAKDNGSFSLVFDSLPIPDKDGRVMVLMSEPLPKDGQQRQDSGNRYQSGYDAQKPQGGAQAGGGYNLDMPDDSDIPF